MDLADVGDYFHIWALELGRTVHITALKNPRAGKTIIDH